MSDENLKEKDDEKDITRRLADMIQSQNLPVFTYRLEALENIVKEKFENGINHQFEKIHDKLDTLKCDVHATQIGSIEKLVEDKYKSLQLKLFWLYGILGTVIGAIVIDFIVNH